MGARYLTKRACLMCGGELPPERSNRATCSDRCQNLRAKTKKMGIDWPFLYKKTCIFCEGEFTTDSWRKQYCSNACRVEAKKERSIERERLLLKELGIDFSDEPVEENALCWTCSRTSHECRWKDSNGRDAVDGAVVLWQHSRYGKDIRGTVVECPLYDQEAV